MLRGTVYIINPDGVSRSRSVRARGPMHVLTDAKSDFRRQVEADMRDNGELRDGERLEFGPIAEEWSAR